MSNGELMIGGVYTIKRYIKYWLSLDCFILELLILMINYFAFNCDKQTKLKCNVILRCSSLV